MESISNMKDFTDIIEILNKYNTGEVKVLSLVITILTIIAMWRIFNKAKEGGWKSIIPIYNVYTLCKIVKLNFWFFLLSIILMIVPIINLISLIYLIAFGIRLNYRLAKSFGHGLLFTLGLILFNTIFILILGFGPDRYQPNRI